MPYLQDLYFWKNFFDGSKTKVSIVKPSGHHEGKDSTHVMEENEIIVPGTFGEKALGPESPYWISSTLGHKLRKMTSSTTEESQVHFIFL